MFCSVSRERKKCSIKSSVVVVVVVAWRTLLPSGCQIDIKLYTLLSFRCCVLQYQKVAIHMWAWHKRKPCLFTAGNNCCCTLLVFSSTQLNLTELNSS